MIAATGERCSIRGKGGDPDDSDRLQRRSTRSRLGLVAGLNRPGGNVTGVTTLNAKLVPKRLELLHELVPTATIIAAARQPDQSRCRDAYEKPQTAARTLGVQLHVLHASTERDFDTVFATLLQLRAGGLMIAPMHSSIAEANSSPHWRSAMRCLRSISIASSPRPAA